jgi:YidC/Oxa1 family membrane protein insertase
MGMARPACRLAGLALCAAVGVITLGGCGRVSVPLSAEDMKRVGKEMQQLDHMPDGMVQEQIGKWRSERDSLRESESRKRSAENGQDIGRLSFLIGYAEEKLASFDRSLRSYQEARQSSYGSLAAFRQGEICRLEKNDQKAAERAYQAVSMTMAQNSGWVRADPSSADSVDREKSVLASDARGELRQRSLRLAAIVRLDRIHRQKWSYNMLDRLVKLMGGNPRYSHGLTLVVLALLVKIATTPLTNASLRSMRKMQALQPEIQELQKRYGNDKQALAREQWNLMRKNKVNPAGGCLPFLIQMPILIYMYNAIRMYTYRFAGARFLWVPSLAQPDGALVVLYGVSMYFSQKLTTMPSADPQQQQMQRMMTWLMPAMLVSFLWQLQSAFILYWFSYNVFFTAHQWYMLRRRQERPAAAEAAPTQGGPGRNVPPGPPRRPKKKRR